jgi:tetratricopeptide (TPR) repeat protein
MPFHFVKWSNPTEVVKVDLETLSSETIHLSKETVKTKRDLRGGSHVVKYGDYYIALTHEVDLWLNDRNQKDSQYYHRFIVWDKDWNVVKITDEFKFFTAGIEFTCGMVMHKNSLLISVGFQDNAAYILELPLTLLDSFLKDDIKLSTKKKKTVNFPTPKLIETFVMDPLVPINNFNLGEFYFKKGHTASALSFFLRCAEYSKDSDLIYESLIKVALCLNKQEQRSTSEKTAYENAIIFQPNRPEAYLLLSLYYERKKDWFTAHMHATIALSKINNLKPTKTYIDIDDDYVFLFQKAVTSWWIGQEEDSKKMFLDIHKKYKDKLNLKYKELVLKNINALGLKI